MIRRLLLSGVTAALLCSSVHAANEPLDTVQVTATREQMRREIQSFVHKVTRLEGEFVGRWDHFVCPVVVGLSDEQSQFIQRRIIDVQNTVRPKRPKADMECDPNLFVVLTDEAEQVLADWKERDPGMFRWKSRDGVSRSKGTGPVRTWHNAIVEAADGRGPGQAARHLDIPSDTTSCPLYGRIESGCWEHITAVVVLVDVRAAGKVTLSQIADFVSVVSLSQIDLSADLGSVDSILTLFAQPRPEFPPAGLTEWDYAFLKGIYRASYSPKDQQRDIAARMVRELVPR